MRLAVIVADATDCFGAGLEITRTVKLFDLPDEVIQYIRDSKLPMYCTVTVALEDAP